VSLLWYCLSCTLGRSASTEIDSSADLFSNSSIYMPAGSNRPSGRSPGGRRVVPLGSRQYLFTLVRSTVALDRADSSPVQFGSEFKDMRQTDGFRQSCGIRPLRNGTVVPFGLARLGRSSGTVPPSCSAKSCEAERIHLTGNSRIQRIGQEFAVHKSSGSPNYGEGPSPTSMA
jgi:hypothetical protein